MSKGSSKGGKMEQLLKKRNLKQGKMKKEASQILAPENAQLCSGNGCDLKVVKDKIKKVIRRQKKNAREAMPVENRCGAEAEKVEEISSLNSLDEDCSGGMKNRFKKARRSVRKNAREAMPVENRSDAEAEQVEEIFSVDENCSRRMRNKLKKATRRQQKNAREPMPVENRCDAEAQKVEEISSVDEDCSRGMKRWVLDYRQGRPGLEVIQQRLDEFMAAYEAEQDQARKEREVQGAEEGWTVVVQHKGRKKTTDSESGIAVGSVALGAVVDKMAKKKQKEHALDFYRFQKREAHRNEVMMLQTKFEQDKKRLQQLRAARKFRPY